MKKAVLIIGLTSLAVYIFTRKPKQYRDEFQYNER